MLRKRWLALAASAFLGTNSYLAAQSKLLYPLPSEEPAAAPTSKTAPAKTAQRSQARGKVLPLQPVDSTTAPSALPVAATTTMPSAPLALTTAASSLDGPGHAGATDCGTGCANGCGTSGGIMAGASLYFLRSHINNNTVFTTTTGIGTPTPVVTSTDFDWNYHIAPAGWLGWSGPNGVGLRGRYFHFDHNSEGARISLDPATAVTATIQPPAGLSPVLGTPPRGFQSPGILLQDARGIDNLAFSSELKIQTIDGEATYLHEGGRFWALLSAGGRYLQMNQGYHGVLVNIIDEANSEISFLESGQNFYGAGPTLSGQAAWRIGNSGLAVFGSARGSFLVGSSRQNTAFSERIVDSFSGNQTNLAITQSRVHSTLPIIELEGGLEYARAVGRTRMFVRAAAVDHVYFDAGSASSRDGNLSLFGGQISVGFGY
jgi:hypothetical protein